MAAASKLLDAANKNNKSNKTKSGKSGSSATGTTLAAAASVGAIAGTLAAIKAQESTASDKDEKVALPANFDSLPEDVQKRILDSMAEASQAGVKSKFSPDVTKKNGTGNYGENSSAEDTITFQNSDLKDKIQLSAGWSDAGYVLDSEYDGIEDIMPKVYNSDYWEDMKNGSDIPLLPTDLDNYSYNKWYLFDPEKVIEDSKGLKLSDIENGIKIIDTVDKVNTGIDVLVKTKAIVNMQEVLQFSHNYDVLNVAAGKVLMKNGNEENGYQPMTATEAAMEVDLLPVLIPYEADAFAYRDGLALALETESNNTDFGMGSVMGNSRMQQVHNIGKKMVKDIAIPTMMTVGGIFSLGDVYYGAIDKVFNGENLFELKPISGEDGK